MMYNKHMKAKTFLITRNVFFIFGEVAKQFPIPVKEIVYEEARNYYSSRKA